MSAHEIGSILQAPSAADRSPASHVSHPSRIDSLPILLLHAHEHCNCRCLMCDIWQRKDGKELDLENFARHRESLIRLGVREVVLTGGEPLLHRDFSALCRFLRQCNVRITLLTTALLLAKRAESVAELIDEVIVSLDGPEEIHDRVRRIPGAFRLIAQGILAVRALRPHLPMQARSTVQKANFSALRQTVAAARRLSLDSISFLAADLTSQAFNRELVWPGERQAEIALTRSEVDELETEVELLIEKNAEDLRSRFIKEQPDKLRRIVRRFREQLGQAEPVAPICNAPWVSAVMEVDGSIRPCFFHDRIGNVRDGTLEKILNGAPAQAFRANLDIKRNPICRRCVCSLNYAP